MKIKIKLVSLFFICNLYAAQEQPQSKSIPTASYFIFHNYYTIKPACITVGRAYVSQINKKKCPLNDHAKEQDTKDATLTFHDKQHTLLATLIIPKTRNLPENLLTHRHLLDPDAKPEAIQAKILQGDGKQKLQFYDSHNHEIGHLNNYQDGLMLSQQSRAVAEKYCDLTKLKKIEDCTKNDQKNESDDDSSE